MTDQSDKPPVGEFCVQGPDGLTDRGLHQAIKDAVDRQALKRLAEKAVLDAIERGIPEDVARSLYGFREED
ncbi:MAG: hypothetical protein D6751_12310 [Deltaproteobacteria bacterium]|nr:MAG: hypothetical protein D6751_12310 [Deltaproteobacteria bacterium]